MATFPVKERFNNLYNYPLGEEPPSAAPVTEVTNVRKKIDPVTGSIFTGTLGAVANLGMNWWNNRANDRRQQEAFRQNLQMWHEQNSYNSPASQIARLKAAGLNPNLIYGSPDNTAQAPPSKGVSEGHAGQVDPMLAMNAMSIVKQMEVSDAEIRLKDAEARNFDADTNLKNEDYDWKPTQRNFETQEHYKNLQYIDQKISTLYGQYQDYLASVDLKGSELAINRNNLRFLEETFESRKSKILEEVNALIAQQIKDKALASQAQAMVSKIMKEVDLLKYQERMYNIWMDPKGTRDKNGTPTSYFELSLEIKRIFDDMQNELLSNELVVSSSGLSDKKEAERLRAWWSQTGWSVFCREILGQFFGSIGQVFGSTYNQSSNSSNVVKEVIKKGK